MTNMNIILNMITVIKISWCLPDGRVATPSLLPCLLSIHASFHLVFFSHTGH